MQYVIIFGVAIALGGWMLYPLLKSSRSGAQASNSNKKTSPKNPKRSSHSQSSKPPAPALSQRPTKDSWQTEDVDVVEELERIRRITDIDAELEREVTRIRQQSKFQEQQQSGGLSAIRIVFCPQCGTRLEASTLRCTRCKINVDQYIKE